MFISIAVGILAGTIGSLSWALIQLLLSTPNVYGQLAGRWYLVPLAIGVLAAVLHLFARKRTVSASSPWRASSLTSMYAQWDDRRLPLADFLESYHFGVFRLSAFIWISRSLVTLACALFGGIFGIEGFLLESTYSAMPILLKAKRLFIEEKQTFVMCTISSAVGVAFGAPFAGIVLSLELLFAHDARVRWGAIVSAMVAFGVAMFWQSTVFANLFVENSLESLTLLGTLFSGLRPSSFSHTEWLLITACAAGLGAIAAFFSTFTVRMLARGSEFFSLMFGNSAHWGMLVAGVLMSLSVWLVPESLVEPWKLWEDLAWLRLSSFGAITILVGTWGLFILAFSGWGSSGVFSPMFVLGALTGYAIGNSIAAPWAVPLAIAGGAAMFGAAFRTPVAAVLVILEVGHVGPAWWLTAVAVIVCTGLSHLFRFKPLHELLLERRGIRVVGGRAASVLATLKSADAMYRDVRTVPENASFKDLREAVAASNHAYLGVLSSDGKYLGILSLEQLPRRIQNLLGPDAREEDIKAVDSIFELRDVIDPYNPTVLPGESLEKALNLLQQSRCVGVVDEHRTLAGFVFESSIISRYNREITNYSMR